MYNDSTAINLSPIVPDFSQHVSVMLDVSGYASKNDVKASTPAISNTIVQNRTTISISELANKVGSKGHTFVPGVLDGGRKAEHWIEQQIFALDFDSGMTTDEFIKRCATIKLQPSFIYHTFSHSISNPKFRAVFRCDQIIGDFRLRNLIQSILMKLFPSCDKACGDPSRLFYGGKNLVFLDEDGKFNPLDLLETFEDEIKGQDPVNASRKLQSFASLHGVKAKGSKFGVDFFIYDEESEETWDRPIYTIGQSRLSSFQTQISREGLVYVLQFDDSVDKLPNDSSDTFFQKQKNKKHQNLPPSPSISHIENENTQKRFTEEDKKVLLQSCLLLNEFISGSRHIPHNERRLILSNLWQRRNGLPWYKEGLQSREDYHDDQNLINSIKRYKFKPESCSHCPYANTCKHKKNILQQIPIKEREFRRIAPAQPGHSIEDSRFRLRDALKNALRCNDTKIHVIKADCGVGKTELLLNEDLSNVCVAFPTHKLKEEAYRRHNQLLNEQNEQNQPNNPNTKTPVFLWPSRPMLPKILDNERIWREELGIGGITKLYHMALSMDEVINDPLWSQNIQNYLHAMNSIHTQSSLFTTHEKALQINNPNLHTFIFDEDLLLGSLIKIHEIYPSDISQVLKAIEHESPTHPTDMEEIKSILQSTLISSSSTYTPNTHPKNDLTIFLIPILEKLGNKLQSPVGKLLNASGWIKDTCHNSRMEKIFCLEKTELLPDRKYIILSATANESLYTKLFGERLDFVDIGRTKMLGKLILHPKRSYSKSNIYGDEGKFIGQVKEDMKGFGFDCVITHKFLEFSLVEAGVPVVGGFGGVQGLDGLGGKSLGVYGTPHLPPYVLKLLFGLLGMAGELDYGRVAVERHGFEFSFMGCAEAAEMVEVQLGLIEAELVQAVGRARLALHEVEVHVFSNVGLEGAVLRGE